MPVPLALASTVHGALYGLFPIGWIVVAAVFLYRITVESGQFEIIKDSIASITEDPPPAGTAHRLQLRRVPRRRRRLRHARRHLGGDAGRPRLRPTPRRRTLPDRQHRPRRLRCHRHADHRGGPGDRPRQRDDLPDGRPSVAAPVAVRPPSGWSISCPAWRGVREVWPAELTAGGTFAVAQWYTSNHLGPQLPDILSSLCSIGGLVILLRVWKPKQIFRFEHESATAAATPAHSRAAVVAAWSPFIVLTLLVGNWGIKPVKTLLDGRHRHGADAVRRPRDRSPGHRPGDRGDLHDELAVGHRKRHPHCRDGVGVHGADVAGHRGSSVRQDTPFAGRTAGHSGRRTRIRLYRQLVGHDHDDGDGAGEYGDALSAVLAAARMAGRVHDRLGHVGQRRVRSSADGLRRRLGVNPVLAIAGEFGRWLSRAR